MFVKYLCAILLSALLLFPIPTRAAAEEIPLHTEAAFVSSYGAQLTDPIAKAAYTALTDQLTPGCTAVTFRISPFDSAQLSRYTASVNSALSAYLFDHPAKQFFDIYNIGIAFSYSASEGTCTLRLVPLPDAATRYEQLLSAARDFVATLSPSLSEVEKYRAIHDYLWAVANYDLTATNAHSAYGLLLDGGAAVCEGYSKAFKILCDEAGLPCMLISGESSPGSGVIDHMWNAVCLDGEWFCVDVTWDDPVGTRIPSAPNLSVNILRRTYFLNNACFTDGDPLQDHRGVGNIDAGADGFSFALPPLSSRSIPAPATDTLGLTVMDDRLYIPVSLYNYSIDGLSLGSLPNRAITLTRNTTAADCLSIPSGQTWFLNTHSDFYTLTRAADYTGPIFRVEGILNYYGRVSDPTVFEMTGGSTLNIHGDVSAPLLTLTGGTVTIDGSFSGCVICQGGTAVINGTAITSTTHRSDSNGCVCGELDVALNSAILSFSDHSITVKAGADVTSVTLCVASYEGEHLTGIRLHTIHTTPGEILRIPVKIPGENFRLFLLDTGFSPLCFPYPS